MSAAKWYSHIHELRVCVFVCSVDNSNYVMSQS